MKIQASPQKRELCLSQATIASAIIEELLDHFSVPAVSGYALHESEAQLIAGGAIERMKSACAESSAKIATPAGSEIVVTSEMIEAGVDAYLGCDREVDAFEQIIREVLEAAIASRPEPSRATSSYPRSNPISPS